MRDQFMDVSKEKATLRSQMSKETRSPYNMFALGRRSIRSNSIDPWPLHLRVNGKREQCWFSQSPERWRAFSKVSVSIIPRAEET